MDIKKPSLPSRRLAPTEVCRVPIYLGRQMAYDDLAANPGRPPEYYGRTAIGYVHASLPQRRAAHMLASLREQADCWLEGFDAEIQCHSNELKTLREAHGFDWCMWMPYIGLGIAQFADGLSRADSADRSEIMSFESFLIEGYVIPPDDTDDIQAIGAVTRPSRPEEPHPVSADGIALVATSADLVDVWLDHRNVRTRAERSRQGSSARHFLAALNIGHTPPSDLTCLGQDAVIRFQDYIAAYPLKPRGERARIAHIKAFLAYARQHIRVPEFDWAVIAEGRTHG